MSNKKYDRYEIQRKCETMDIVDFCKFCFDNSDNLSFIEFDDRGAPYSKSSFVNLSCPSSAKPWWKIDIDLSNLRYGDMIEVRWTGYGFYRPLRFARAVFLSRETYTFGGGEHAERMIEIGWKEFILSLYSKEDKPNGL